MHRLTRVRSFGAFAGTRRAVGHLAAVLVLGSSIGAGVVLATTQVAAAATDTVTNCSGDPSDAGSLPYEVLNAASGDTIVFALSPPCSLISLDGTIDISNDLTITGPGSASLAVSGGSANEVFDVASGTVGISGLTIEDGMTAAGKTGTSTPGQDGGTGGNGGDGGGIYNDGTLTLSNDVVSGNTTGAGGVGGYGYQGAGTGTGGQGGNGGDGGGIYNDGTLTLTDVAVSGNSTGAGGGGGAGDQIGGNGGNSGNGGGIYNDADGNLTLTDVSLSGNATGVGGTADTGGPESFGGSGGNSGDGGAIFNSGDLSITGGSATDDATGPGGAGGSTDANSGNGGSSGDGGGIYNVSPDTVSLTTTTIDSDSTGVGGEAGTIYGGATGGNGGNGGGIYSSGTLTISSSTVADDSTGSGSSGDNSEVIGDSGGSGGSGGGIYSSSTLVATNDTLAGNETGSGANGDAGSGSDGGSGGNGGNGGGIYTSYELFAQSLTVVGNEAGSGGTGAEGSDSSGTNGSDGTGGGIDAAAGTNILTSTVVAESPDGGACSGTITDNGYNIDDDTTCSFTSPSINDSSSLDSKIGPLAQNGGPTKTIAIKKGPSVDVVTSVDCPLTDQRGASRTAPCDIGAYDTDGTPKISSFTPLYGRKKEVVTIKGTALGGATSVLFNGTPAVITSDSATTITTKVPKGATSGRISVTTSVGGTAVSKKSFTVT